MNSPHGRQKTEAQKRALYGPLLHSHANTGQDATGAQPRGQRLHGVDGEHVGHNPGTLTACGAATRYVGTVIPLPAERAGIEQRRGLGEQKEVRRQEGNEKSARLAAYATIGARGELSFIVEFWPSADASC